MKISELVAQLIEIKEQHGDVDVYCWPYDGQNHLHEIGEESAGKIAPVNSPLAGNRKVLFIDEGWS
jgi:hypothetical protein